MPAGTRNHTGPSLASSNASGFGSTRPLPPRDCIGETSVPSDPSGPRCRRGKKPPRAAPGRGQLDRVDDDVLAGARLRVDDDVREQALRIPLDDAPVDVAERVRGVRHDRDLAAEPAGARQAVPHRRRRERPRLVEVAAHYGGRREALDRLRYPAAHGRGHPERRPGRGCGDRRRARLERRLGLGGRVGPEDDQRGGCHDRQDERRRPRQAASLPR